ncbi:hypothetical protein, partial [Levilactobacillus cerevisiae]|uniref:hypothetical protein n=1 Tax=Levilactobacillus cerevisiae TaxID=1704076 RepID=UPI001CDD8F88
LFYFSDFQNRQKTGISYSPIPESVDPLNTDNQTIQAQDYSVITVNARQLTAICHTLATAFRPKFGER